MKIQFDSTMICIISYMLMIFNQLDFVINNTIIITFVAIIVNTK